MFLMTSNNKSATSRLTLGLDLGSNSIGWALIDEPAGKLLGIGSRVFPEGVDRDQTGGEHPKNEQRRIARGMRRQIARRARRKAVLRRSLVECGLLPSDPEQQRTLDELDPYVLRSRALSEALMPHEIGRLLIHLNQHRGFLSNRKADRSKAKENSEMLAEINDLAAQIGEQTLGQFFAASREVNPHDKVRGKHTRRDMYLKEFDRIWETQRQHHPQLLTDELKFGRRGELKYPRKPEPLRKRKSSSLLAEYGIHGILFFQRALYWPKSVIGVCELEPKQKRCPKADRLAQRFRILNEVNNLRILPQRGEPRGLDPDERSKLVAHLTEKKERTFDDLRKCLGLLEGDGFNLEAGGRKKLLGMPVDAILAHKDLFGPAWKKRPDAEKTQIVRSLIDDNEDTIQQKATTEWGCTPELAERLIDTDLGEGYMSVSRVAIEKLLPHLERGLMMMSRDGSPSALSEAGYLRPDQRVANEKDELPLVPDDIVNPLVRQALFEVRKVVNAIIREFGKPVAIHIEMAREVKGTADSRSKDSARMRDRERARDDAAEWVRERGFKVSRDAIERYLLWKEQGELCMYSGRPISPPQLLGGEVELEHVLPYSRSLDNSLANKVLAYRSENQLKGQRTPYEWLSGMDDAKFEAILQRAGNLPYEVRNSKRQKLQQQTVELDQFLHRQLNDTAYITKKVREYVECLGCDVVASKGQCTAELRHMWGLDTVLRDDGLKLKNRDDHRHHAVDALVIALTDRSRLQQLARIRYSDEQLHMPWTNFRDAVEEVVSMIKVSHCVSRKVSGALHDGTIYGPTSKPHRANNGERGHANGWVENEGEFVRRKPVKELDNTKQLAKVRDVTIRNILQDHLRSHGIDPEKPGKIQPTVWKSIPVMASGRPIFRVRMIEASTSMKLVRANQFAEPGANHHMEICELENDQGQLVLQKDGTPKRVGVLVTQFDAAARIKARMPIIDRRHHPGRRFVMSFSINEMFFLEMPDGTHVLHRIQKMSEGSIILRPHTYAGKVSDTDKPPIIQRRTPNTLRGYKVTIDPLGRIRNAND